MASVDDLRLVDFGEPYPGEPAAHRPALVLGPPDTFGPGFPFVIVAPLTTRHRACPYTSKWKQTSTPASTNSVTSSAS